MNFSISKKKQAKEKAPANQPGEMNGINSFVAQFFVFYGEKYLGWDCFDNRTVRVGKSPSVDLVLDDQRIADVQAEFTIVDQAITVTDCAGNGVMTVNAKPVSQHTLGAFDVVKIGKYSVKIKLKPIEAVPGVGADIKPGKAATTKKTPATKPVAAGNVKEKKAIPAQAPVPKPQPEPEVPAKPVAVQKTELQDTLSKGLKAIMDEELDAVDIEDILAPESLEDSADEDLANAFDLTDSFDLGQLEIDEDMIGAEPEIPVSPSVAHTLSGETDGPLPEMSWDEFTGEIPNEAPAASAKADEKPSPAKKDIKVRERKAVKKVLKARPETVIPEKPSKPEILNTFPPSFFNVIEDEEDEDDDDMPANFSLRDKLVGSERNIGRSPMGEKVLEVIRFRKDSVMDITHLKGQGDHVLVDDGNHFCRLSYNEKQGMNLLFNESLLGVINKSQGKEFNAEKKLSAKSLLSREKTYSSMLPVKGELALSDGFYDYVLRQSFINEGPVIREPRKNEHLPVHKRMLKSTTFKYASRAVIFHFILIVILSYSITMPDKEEFKDPETYFVMLETENIHKPVKPKPKPPAPKPKKAEKMTKKIPKKSVQVAQTRPKKTVKKAEPPKAGGGHKGNVVNRNVNEVGLLATLGMKTGIEIKPNDALASVTNMDAVTSTHASEATLKLGGLVADMGDSRIAIPTGGVINNKGAADVLRSAGIGGKGNVAALENGKTGNREVSGAVTAPLTKKVKFKGGGISREAVAKVINEHIDEINYCYETALIGDPTLMGKIIFEWTILLSGEVGEVKIQTSSVRSNEIHACIKSAIRTWKFPKPKGSAVVVSYPFVFDVSGF